MRKRLIALCGRDSNFFFLSSSCIVVVCVCVYVMYTHCLGEGCGHEALSSGFLSKIPPVSFQPSVRLVTASLLSIFFFYISVCVFLVFVLFCFRIVLLLCQHVALLDSLRCALVFSLDRRCGRIEQLSAISSPSWSAEHESSTSRKNHTRHPHGRFQQTD